MARAGRPVRRDPAFAPSFVQPSHRSPPLCRRPSPGARSHREARPGPWPVDGCPKR